METVEPVVPLDVELPPQLLLGSGKASLDEFERYRSPLKDFYHGKIVFLTGGTGFLGKLYVEKLIRCGVSEILLLSRAKKGKTPYERLASILGSEPIFTTYHSNPEHYHDKIKIIDGDISKNQLSISNDDLSYVVNNANIFFHAAADVRFDESLKESVETNVRGTLEVLKIAAQAKVLDVFVYISTAFSNCTRNTIEEKFYKPQVDPYLLIKLVEMEQDEESFEVLSRKIIEPWPNTYAFTKALAEDLVRQFADKVPVAVIRPSIGDDPIPGWTDNLYGFNGVVIGAATGALRIFHINNDFRADIIPADIVMNATLAIGWYAKNHPDETNIINCTAADNPVTWGMVRTEQMKWKGKIPFLKSLWIPTYNTTRYYVLSEILKIFYHLIPAVLFDLGLRFNSQKPQIVKLYRKVHKFSEVLCFFTNNEWDFRNEQFHKVLAQMSEEDQRYFPCDAKRIDWKDFLAHNVIGLRMYLMKEKWDNLEQARARYRKQWMAHMVFLAIFYAVMGYLLYKLFLEAGLKEILGSWFV
ncbi:fatty acyl-CoA reductase 1 [Culex quinquefasciatus]|uniref:Fatty acyl-CoA reductase n=1 Tax=Culex quinquefasciatus TaxID=7176 RepID=B0WVA4_CULQU|nr:fatty acyl-CoA reductase 1 [Culex quinquefasciatus]|eukprot:XP_001861326.1 fatty acyl-CoA reductase 1 [Culex quinquefasciatus]